MTSSTVEDHLATPAYQERASAGWLVVFGSTLALIVGNGPIILFTFGVLLQPISAEFGWPRGSLATAVVVSHITGAVMMPFVGMLVDRFGVKRIALPAIALFAATTAYAGLLGNNLTAFIVLYGFLGLFGAGHSTLIYARAVSTWFDARRGLALGITLAGIGIGAATVPKYTHYFVANYGWREAYFALGALLFVVGFTAVALFVRDRPVRDRAAEAVLTDGLTLREAISGYRFWFASVAMMLAAAAINGTIAHIVPVLSDRGISAGVATTAVAASGLSLIIGRMLSGFALDRYQGPLVASFFFLIPLVGMGILGFGAIGPMAIVAAVLLGLGIGAEGDIMAYLTGRYFGMKHYGLIYGCVLAFFTLGSGLGPWLMAHAYDLYHTYAAGLIGLGVALMVAVVLVASLGAYRYPPRTR
ncbi:MFS transporter [Tardiphaga sp.]|uniref:MFS transporter n=1 Tax=Tardiphaga sp. TaxID=1926292 RepID=UPI00262F6F26|nr:MFS transporter [Tardiphaga sp.]MDB5618001.1 putative family arabinose efflux permease [Tardiphaga sp.]